MTVCTICEKRIKIEAHCLEKNIWARFPEFPDPTCLACLDGVASCRGYDLSDSFITNEDNMRIRFYGDSGMMDMRPTEIRRGTNWSDSLPDHLTGPWRQRCKICLGHDSMNYRVSDDLWNELIPAKCRNSVACLSCLDYLGSRKGIPFCYDIDNVIFVGETTIMYLNIEKAHLPPKIRIFDKTATPTAANEAQGEPSCI